MITDAPHLSGWFERTLRPHIFGTTTERCSNLRPGPLKDGEGYANDPYIHSDLLPVTTPHHRHTHYSLIMSSSDYPSSWFKEGDVVDILIQKRAGTEGRIFRVRPPDTRTSDAHANAEYLPEYRVEVIHLRDETMYRNSGTPWPSRISHQALSKTKGGEVNDEFWKSDSTAFVLRKFTHPFKGGIKELNPGDVVLIHGEGTTESGGRAKMQAPAKAFYEVSKMNVSVEKVNVTFHSRMIPQQDLELVSSAHVQQ
ncbi:hypothetical protein BXZ70DRAFT_446646 [Cristinia sonorae]|uniref:Uncharacterized protein n=1 Tax=Cristinia sonorae TaxID=1940300 RepID=A0A8K0UHY9_9AGAR|nr:hypothetical protein BXZ70DRAFT_446646 [Cristinia sonorae]